jgi:branched-chain amino acid transport system substrate-binding protein
VSRRAFLKLAGVSGATIGLGAALGGLLAGCGDEEATATTTTAGPATTAGVTTTAGATTTVSTGAEMGREIKLGYVIAQTGPSANLGQADIWSTDKFLAHTGGLIVAGDKKAHPISVKVVDNQSSGSRASQVAGDLILNDKVDMLLTNSVGELVNAVADQAEANGVPLLATEVPFETFFFGRGAKDPQVGFEWTYSAFMSVMDNSAMYFKLWPQIPTNRVVGVLWPNDADGIAYRKAWPAALEKNGYTYIDAGAFNDGNEDFSSIIQEFKKGGVEIVSGIMAPPDFAVFWNQCFQNSFLPQTVGVAKPALFPQRIEALGDIGVGLTSTIWWHPTWPFTSALTFLFPGKLMVISIGGLSSQ